MIEGYHRGNRPSTPITHREMETIRLFLTGMHRGEIAVHMGITEKTVQTHLMHVYTKIRIHSFYELICWGIVWDIVPKDSALGQALQARRGMQE